MESFPLQWPADASTSLMWDCVTDMEQFGPVPWNNGEGKSRRQPGNQCSPGNMTALKMLCASSSLASSAYRILTSSLCHVECWSNATNIAATSCILSDHNTVYVF